MSTALARPAVSTDELKRAWLAVQAGQFRNGSRRCGPSPGWVRPGSEGVWEPAEPVLPVVGCHGGAGATTLAVAVASALGNARVIECANATASGLAAAATAELGESNGWSRGSRDQVMLERVSTTVTGPEEVPLPTTPTRPMMLTVLDLSWELGQLLAGSTWLAEQARIAPTIIVVTSATVPGLRRLEGVVTMLSGVVVAGVVGPRRARWPRGLKATVGPRTRDLDRRGHLVDIPTDAALAARGLDSQPLPPALLSAAATLRRVARADIDDEDLPS